MGELRQTTERLAIHRLIAVHAQLLDSGRLDDWGQLFTEEAHFRVYRQTYESRATIVAEIGGMVSRRQFERFARAADNRPSGSAPERHRARVT